MTMNRSSMPSLLRKKGGGISFREMVKKNYGSETHGSMDNEITFKKLGAKPSEIKNTGAHQCPETKPRKANDGTVKVKRDLLARKGAKAFPKDGMEDFGPNSPVKMGRMKRGGKAECAAGGNWIQGAIKHPGALRQTLKAKPGMPIPEAKLEKAEHSRNPLTRKRARLAETLRGLNRGR